MTPWHRQKGCARRADEAVPGHSDEAMPHHSVEAVRRRAGRIRWLRTGVLGTLGSVVLLAVAAGSLAAVDDGPLAVLTVEPEAVAAETREVTRPPLIRKLVPFGKTRKRQTAAYGKRHYDSYSYRLRPKTIILHYTAGGTWRSVWNYFAANRRDGEFGEKPGPVAHFIIGKDGKIYHLLGTLYRGRHCVGLNHRAIGIEFVQEAGPNGHWASRQILNRKKQVQAGLRLVRWLQKKYHIKTTLVYGHAFANKHPMFKELRGWRNTHGDWPLKETKIFRARLKRMD